MGCKYTIKVLELVDFEGGVHTKKYHCANEEDHSGNACLFVIPTKECEYG